MSKGPVLILLASFDAASPLFRRGHVFPALDLAGIPMLDRCKEVFRVLPFKETSLTLGPNQMRPLPVLQTAFLVASCPMLV